MASYSKINIIYRLQKWMDSVPGQTFLNYAYSWGAALVITGVLFKFMHLPAANIMLYVGLGTEIIVFILSAFDRPFDKTADGLDIPVHVTEDYLEGKPAAPQPSAPHASVPATAPVAAAATEEMGTAQSNYVAELNRLTEMLGKVNEQSLRLTRDSEEMESLNRTLTGINKVYEMQLRSAGQQIGTIDQINEQCRQMAVHIEQLNRIYARMIEAMTVNMRAAGNGSASV